MSLVKELTLPPAVSDDEKAFEVLRVWVANGHQEVVLRKEVWKDPAIWGIMLADLAKHVARAYAGDGGLSEQVNLKRIVQAFSAETE